MKNEKRDEREGGCLTGWAEESPSIEERRGCGEQVGCLIESVEEPVGGRSLGRTDFKMNGDRKVA